MVYLVGNLLKCAYLLFGEVGFYPFVYICKHVVEAAAVLMRFFCQPDKTPSMVLSGGLFCYQPLLLEYLDTPCHCRLVQAVVFCEFVLAYSVSVVEGKKEKKLAASYTCVEFFQFFFYKRVVRSVGYTEDPSDRLVFHRAYYTGPLVDMSTKGAYTQSMSADNNSDSNSNSDRIVQAMFRYDILNKLPRTGFLMRGVDNPESIGEHIFSTTVLAILILEEMAREGYEVDSAKVLKMAALHETGEILVGDIPHPAISYMGEEVKTRMEREAGKRVLEGFPALQELIEEFEGNETLEARIVYSLDKLQMLIKILLYESENKGHLDDFWRYAGNKRKIGIPVIDDIFDRLLELRGTFHLDYLGMT